MISFQKPFGNKLYEPIENQVEIQAVDYITELNEGPIVIIFKHLPEWDKMQFALTCKKIQQVYQKYECIQIPEENANKILELMWIYKEIASANQSFEKWDKLRFKCLSCCDYNSIRENIFFTKLFSSFTSFGTALTACIKSCGACTCCCGTAASFGIASGTACGVCLLSCCLGFALSYPASYEENAKLCNNKLKNLKQREITLTAELKPPAEIKMDENYDGRA